MIKVKHFAVFAALHQCRGLLLTGRLLAMYGGLQQNIFLNHVKVIIVIAKQKEIKKLLALQSRKAIVTQIAT